MNKNNCINGLCLILMGELKANGAKTGYDFTKVIPNTSHQQIYRELTKLQNSGYIHFTVVPQIDKPDKKVYKIINNRHAREFFNDAIPKLPINKNVPVHSLEGVFRSIDYADPQVIIDWCKRYIEVYSKAKESAQKHNLTAEAFIRGSHVEFAELIMQKAQEKSEPVAVVNG